MLRYTLYCHNMLANLLGDMRVGHELYQVINGVYRRMNALETLYFLSDGERMIVPTLASCHFFFLDVRSSLATIYHINGIAPKRVASPAAGRFTRSFDRVAAGTCNICQIPVFINIIGRDRRRWLCDTFAIAMGNAQFSWKQLRTTIWPNSSIY